MSYDTDSSDEEMSDGGWIQWFCNIEGHEFFLEVDEDYIRDAFNLYGLRNKVAQYADALEMVLSPDSPQEEDLQDEAFVNLYQAASDLYGLIHCRFIMSVRGLSLMKDKFIAGMFGRCPRLLCEKQNVLPIGVSEELRTSRVKVYCPRCQDVYIPSTPHEDVDGAYFGTSFPQLFLLAYPELQPSRQLAEFVPKVYGFRVYKSKGSRYDHNGKKRA